MPQEFGAHMLSLSVEMLADSVEVGSIPQHDRARVQVESARAMALRLQRVVPDATNPVEEHGAFKRVLGLALV